MYMKVGPSNSTHLYTFCFVDYLFYICSHENPLNKEDWLRNGMEREKQAYNELYLSPCSLC